MIDSKYKNYIWTEKYRPSKVDDFVGNDLVKDSISKWVEDEEIPHLLFYGQQGTGKTTLALMIVDSIECDYLYINASDKSGVDFIRNEVIPFANNVGFSPKKIVILDECLEEGTLVTVLRNGNEVKIPIEDVDAKNDLVKSYDIDKNRIEWQPFYLFNKGVQNIWEIQLENGEVVRCTEDHKWFVEDDSGNTIVVKTVDLYNQKYQHILSPKNENDSFQKELKNIKIKSITKTEDTNLVYDLSVKKNKNFFIGDTETLTHNCDFLSTNAQASLRNVMETSSKNTRFILTCNYIEKIIPALESRTQSFKIEPPSKKNFAIRLSSILDTEKIEYEAKDVASIVNKKYPDLRKSINMMQQYIDKSKLDLSKNTSSVSFNYMNDIVKEFSSDKSERDLIISIRTIINDSGVSMFTDLFSFLYDHLPDITTKDNYYKLIPIIAEYQYMDSFVIDKEINIMAMFVKLIETIKK